MRDGDDRSADAGAHSEFWSGHALVVCLFLLGLVVAFLVGYGVGKP